MHNVSWSCSVSSKNSYLNHYPEYKEKYNIMSVPCTIIDRKKVIFGKKSFEEIVTFIEEQEL